MAIIGFLLCFVGLLLMVIITPVQIFRKKKWNTPWIIGMIAIVIGGISIVVGAATTPNAPVPKLSVAEWKKHRSYVESLAKGAIVGDDIAKVYEAAHSYRTDGYIDHCKLGGCEEMRDYLDEIIKASGDGYISPAEMEQIKEKARSLGAALNRAELETVDHGHK
jgi:hypothetical protein